jgi:hypothetical protein
MVCSQCHTTQDPDSRFCSECGARLAEPRKSRSVYAYALLLLPVIVLAGAIGYYKFVLPQGIAAVVNGEEITQAELEQEISRVEGPGGPADPGVRYQALDGLITERIMLQEARKAATDVSREELAAAIADVRAKSGLDKERFNQHAESQFGSIRKFEAAFRNRLIVNKYIAAHVVPPGADQQSARQAIEQWIQKTSDAAIVRITLAEQWAGAGCGGCVNRDGAAAQAAGGCGKSGAGCRIAKNGAASGQTAVPAGDRPNGNKAAEAGLSYWHEKHGSDAVTATVTDFGCHMQVDIMKDNIKIGSLRYQGGRISE